MSDPGNTAERMRGHEAWILIRRILAAPSPDVERHHIDAARDWLTRQRTLPDDFLRDGEMLRSVRAVAAGAGDPSLHAVHREESIMAEKCPWSGNGAHHYVAVVEQEVRTTTGETTTATYTQAIFCVQCGHKL